ncbi:hypothetical protein C461_05292 [Halorubrum aidingense JCM 13560]|uniref:Uncharacterized protein n=2 Tax=Halorubrum aidingense TaxID=368623 RepID=M0PHG4_9EURY|nr:hypothetical protein C461_05292 [Halorubrum aidingense JCM 13560]
MKLRFNHSSLGDLPPPGVTWRWGDVVGTEDGKVDPVEAHAARSLIEKRDDGRYETTSWLAEYLDDQYSITLTGEPVKTDAAQQALPGIDAGSRAVRADGSGSTAATTSNPGAGRQVSLTGENASAAVAELRAAEAVRVNAAKADQDRESRADGARRVAGQATIATYVDAAVAGGIRRSAGDVYASPVPESVGAPVPSGASIA